MKIQKVKFIALILFGLLATAAPTGAVVAMNWQEYTSHGPANTVGFCAGLGGVVFLLLRFLLCGDGKIKSLELSGWALILSVLMKESLEDLPVMCITFFIGRVLYFIFFETAIEQARKKWKARKEKHNE